MMTAQPNDKMTKNRHAANNQIIDMRLLTFNAHEAYVYALSKIGYKWDVIDPLPGRYTNGWDVNMRPVPENINLISIEQALTGSVEYSCAIAHSIDDLLLIKSLNIPKILVIHVSLKGYIAQENSRTTVEEMQQLLNTYLDKIGAVAVSVSELKQAAWGVFGPVIPFFIDTDFFKGYRGENACGLRIANQISKKSLLLDWETHLKIAAGFPVKIAGFNPDMHGVQPTKNQHELLELYQNCRFYLHTAQNEFEDGYNTASLEAMAAGMPVVCNSHPSAPVINGVNGFISDNIDDLREGIKQLQADRELAEKLGKAGREFVMENHSLEKYRKAWEQAIELAVNFYR